MPTFSWMPSAARPPRRDLVARARVRLSRTASAEDGFLLIEVMVSALLVGLIAVATFNGFAVASRFSADERRHSEASLLAAQSQEQLRSDPATALDALETEPHVYTKTINGTEFTVTQEAKAVSSSGNATGCTVSESSKEHGANVLVTSSVTWALLIKAKRPAVKQASIITPPIGSALEVDVSNGQAPPEPVSGVTAIAKFVPEGSGSTNTAQGTTGSAGCVVLSGLAATSAEVEIESKPNFITTASLLQYPTKEVTIVPNLTTQYPVTYAEGARLSAEFTYKGSNKLGAVTVTGDTFGVTNSSIPSGSTKFAVGGTAFEYEKGEEQLYTVVSGTYAAKAYTAAGTSYLTGDLFPFPSGWTGYAGDCPNNDIGTEAESPAPGIVLAPGEMKTIKIPLSYTTLNVHVGTQGSSTEKGLSTEALPVTVTDTQCEGYEKPLHSAAANLRHTQVLNGAGHLSAPFQPFGKATLCVLSKERSYTVSYTNSNATGSTKSIYLEEISNSEKEAKRKEEEATSKTTRENEEKTVKSNREAEEATTRKTAETKESGESATKVKEEETEDKKWQKEETEKKLSRFSREEKEKNYKKNRETEEKSKKTSRESSEASTRSSKESTEATNNKAKKTAEESANSTKKSTEENEIKNKEVVVGSKGSKC
jgi:Tfp pilus assembly protein PilV